MKKPMAKVPAEPAQAFAYFVNKCAEGYGRELLAEGLSETQARTRN